MNRWIGLILILALVGAMPCALAEAPEAAIPALDSTKWRYDAGDGVYWQVGVAYCAQPADAQRETLGVFVPAAYFDAVDNGDGTYTCTVNAAATVGGYSAATAPVVIPVETPGYSAMDAPTGYVSAAARYTDAGFVYVKAGCRGREAGAPAGVTDLKAAVRFLRYSAENIPGSVDRIFTFGMSGGGAQSALLGATGDSALYEPYLAAIGAVEGYSDAVAGSMCWCPITNLDTANEAYEWNLGTSRTGLDAETQALSDGMADAYAAYINALGLVDAQGNVLTLDGAARGVRDTGSYADALKSLIETSLNNFLADTSFPYAASSGGKGGHGDMNFGGGCPDGELPRDVDPDGELPEGARPDGERAMNGTRGGGLTAQDWADGAVDDGIQRMDGSGAAGGLATYETAQDYIDALNGDDPWIEYDGATNTATILSVAGFVNACKPATKSVGAFDDLDRVQGENVLFGYGDGAGAHFDPILAELLTDVERAAAFAEDLERTDSQGNAVEVRVNMYNPMYYIEDYYDGYRTANVAAHWRIRTGITQGDTALNTEMNLALALAAYGAEVDFETVWAQGHVEAERSGTSTENFIAWINACLNGEAA